jgi:hypothetical protein
MIKANHTSSPEYSPSSKLPNKPDSRRYGVGIRTRNTDVFYDNINLRTRGIAHEQE